MVQFVSQACPRRAIERVPKGAHLRDVRPTEPNPDRLPAKGVVGIERAGAVHGAPLHRRIEIGDWGVRPSATRLSIRRFWHRRSAAGDYDSSSLRHDRGPVADRTETLRAMKGRWHLAAAVRALAPLPYILALGALSAGAPLSFGGAGVRDV